MTLGEAETIRFVLHCRAIGVADGAAAYGVRAADSPLRAVPLDGRLIGLRDGAGRPMDSAYGGTQGDDTTVQQAVQALRFFNNDMYYTPQEVELLLAAVGGASVKDREAFFSECLRRRRRERHIWADTPLAKVLTPFFHRYLGSMPTANAKGPGREVGAT